MNQALIYFPCLALLILTVFVLRRMFILRVKAVKEGKVKISSFKTYQDEGSHPELMLQASRNFSNLFEVPTLFYMVALFAYASSSVDLIFLVLAWLYVLLRYAHSYVHLTTNNIEQRMITYATSWVVLIIMALKLGYDII